MNFKQLMRLKDLNMWFLASAIALNVFWTLLLTVFVSILFLRGVQGGDMIMQALLIAATFIGPFLIGWVIGSMAADGRGPTYGVYGSIGSMMILLLVAVPATGLLGVMMLVVAFAGGFNGGMFSVRGKLRE